MSVYSVFAGSDAEKTRELYAKLEALGPSGVLAANLLRAQKCSTRAKDYRRRHKGDAYGRKQWSIGNACAVLEVNPSLLVAWGWREDAQFEHFPWVVYFDLPTGQVSFHSPTRGNGPEYPHEWDGVRDASSGRVVRFAESLLDPSAVVSIFEASDEELKMDKQPHGLVHGTPGPCQPELFP